VPGFKVTEAASGEEGLHRARSERPDVIVLDLVMPGMDGRDALAALRRDPNTADIPIIVSTGLELTDEEHRILLEQATAILPKRNLTRTTAPAMIRKAMERAPGLTTRTEDTA
jgi:CheY-like chemotaxis protein